MPKILCVGALAMDTIFRLDRLPDAPGKVIPLDAVEVAEGMAAAQATTITRLGGQAALWASIGDDPIGARLVSQISGEGVDCGEIRTVPGAPSGFASILMEAGGNTIIVPRYDPALTSTPEIVPALDGFDAVMVDVRWPAAAQLALTAARDAGIFGILDADMAPRDLLEHLVPLASHIVASEGAAKLLTGTDSPKAAAAALGDSQQAFVAVTAGAEGCWWLDAGQVRHTPAPQVAAIDTLAAGDVFHGAFALGLTEGWSMAEIIRFSSAAAALKCTRFGGRLGAPTRAEVSAFLEA
ncbi:PfkB family carbohydrate kinase [Devosia sp.]|uniref:PfkB family carbohydrate kinase n=1 Tax=Devosia sp. TaxID=1871048 RepID=UPI003A8E1909